jgi:ribosomal protein L37E
MNAVAVMPPPTITCQQCGREAPYGPYRHYCQRCRYSRTGKPIKWKFTPAIDARLEAIYKHPDSRSRMTATQYAAQMGWPKHVLIHRAGVLGLSRKRAADYYWDAPEEEILEANAWKSPGRISVILRARGFHRSRAAIMLKLKRMHIFKRDQTDVYSACSLAKMLGIDSHQVVRWIKLRMLKVRGKARNGTKGRAGICGPSSIPMCASLSRSIRWSSICGR